MQSSNPHALRSVTACAKPNMAGSLVLRQDRQTWNQGMCRNRQTYLRSCNRQPTAQQRGQDNGKAMRTGSERATRNVSNQTQNCNMGYIGRNLFLHVRHWLIVLVLYDNYLLHRWLILIPPPGPGKPVLAVWLECLFSFFFNPFSQNGEQRTQTQLYL